MTFNELGISPALVLALARQEITDPTAVQSVAIPEILAGKDAYVHSETGSGKTLAYLLPVFCRLDPSQAATQAVVVAPTHELALQIQRQACDLAQNAGMPVRVLLLIGGTSMDRQLEKLKKKPHVVVGAPGRVQELIAAGKLKAHTVRTVVLDEADVLLGSKTLDAVRKIVLATPGGRQLVCVSATQLDGNTNELQVLAPNYVLLQGGPSQVNANIEHFFSVCEERDKPDVLRRFIHAMNPERALAFVHRNATALTVSLKLAHHKVAATDLHGAVDKSARKKAMDEFRAGRTRVLIASDLAARGLDIAGVSHVFNLDAPSQSKAYIHRAGRTARAGASGVAVSLLTKDEVRLVRRYEQDLGITMTECRLREGRVVLMGR
jgi:superfamily II DNA/RNA helicase